MSIPSNGWLPNTTTQATQAFEPAVPNAYGEQDQVGPEEETSFMDFLFGDDGIDLYDAIDIVNPLQHIPVVNTLYREMTGDEIGYGARMAGGTLYGGVIGLASVAVSAAVDAVSGRDVGEHALAMVEGEDARPADTPLLASWFAQQDEAQPVLQTAPESANEPVLAVLDPDATEPAEPPKPAAGDQPDASPLVVADGMAHFSAFAANGQLMSPAELAAKLNQQRADQQRASIDRAEEFDDESEDGLGDWWADTPAQPEPATSLPDPAPEPALVTETPEPESPGAFPHNNGQAPALGNWFDGAVMDALQKYQALQQERTSGQ